MRNCVDCRFYKKRGDYISKCLETTEYIDIERSPSYTMITRCGPEGKLWEQRQPTNMEKIIEHIKSIKIEW